MILPTNTVSTKNIIQGLEDFVDITTNSVNGNTEYDCAGNDPQCQIKLQSALRPGWYIFEFIVFTKEGKIKNPKLYFDTGNGYNETETLVLPAIKDNFYKSFIWVTKKTSKIRFDITENNPVVVEIPDLSLSYLTIVQLFKEIYKAIRQPGNSRYSVNCFIRAFFFQVTKTGAQIEYLLSRNSISTDPFCYKNWIAQYDSFSKSDFEQLRVTQTGFKYRPLVTILLPVYNTPADWLSQCITSVLDQVYDNWELCIADDNSSDKHVKKLILEFAARENRIKYTFRESNGHIAVASNTALNMATGEFVTFLDHDDKLAPLALYRVVEALNQDSSVDFFYSDEDKIDETGERSLPFFKPGWSPTLFYSQNYITHLACIRAVFLKKVNGFTDGLQGSQDYDLFLKVIANGARLKHLPYILYHWRLHKASTSMESGAKPYAHVAGKKALENYLTKKYPLQYKNVDDGNYTFTYLPRFRFETKNKISIIIPTKDKVEYLKPCIESIFKKSTWKNFEIIILNNNSEEQLTFSYFKEIAEKYKNIKIVEAFFDFNWSKLNNLGYRSASGEFLIFLNNDIDIITADWMERLCETASLPDVASVGASLLYEDNTLQHAGVVVGMNGWADHVFKGMPASHFPSPYISNEIPHNVLAVTGACLAIERSKFETLGLFDEAFIICGSDVELGIRAHKLQMYNVVLANVKLYHFESKSRGNEVPENDFIQSSIKYEPYRTQETDPFFNPNLSLRHTSPVCKS